MLAVAVSCEPVAARRALAQSKAEPESWILWRSGPIAFPDVISPATAESLANGPVINFGDEGADLTIVLPDEMSDDHDDRALAVMARHIQGKAPRAALIRASELSATGAERQLIVLGTFACSSLARSLRSAAGDDYLADVPSGGYHLRTIAHPNAAGKRAILALGADMRGAWGAATVLAHAVHPKQPRLGTLSRWPVVIEDGCHWAPFEARCASSPNEVDDIAPSTPPSPPQVPFGVRCWGSPMPTLASYQRMVRALAATGMNTIVVQSGGWVDLPDAAETFRRAVDLAYREGIFTVLYVGNEEKAHLPAALTDNHRAVVEAVKNLPGLLGFHVYNQLAADMPPEDYAMLADQVRWLRSRTAKPIGVEVVWGHNSVALPESKARLVRDLKSWGVDTIAHDYAPIGGWSQTHDLSLFEGRFRQLEPFGVKREAVLQAHVPFLEPTVPTRWELRNQFWWCLAAGVDAYYVECAFLGNHFSNRGLLNWAFEPHDDGRFAEVTELAAAAKALSPMLTRSRPATESEVAELGWGATTPEGEVAVRFRRGEGESWYVVAVNRSLDRAAVATLSRGAGRGSLSAQPLYPAAPAETWPAGASLAMPLAPGGGACWCIDAAP